MEQKKMCLDDKIFRFIYIGAMRDAILQLAYKGEKKWLMEANILNVLRDEIKPFIDKILNGEYLSQDEYDKDFLRITINICEYINDNHKANNNFTFGNAQKFLNIMIKYFYITSYKIDNLKENFRFCHCPMDQQLLVNIWSNRKQLDFVKQLGKRESFLKSWGNEEFAINDDGEKTYPERYILFQHAVRCIAKDMSPLEYDYHIW